MRAFRHANQRNQHCRSRAVRTAMPELVLFASGCCREFSNGCAAGYGVYGEGPAARVRISEPLPMLQQTAPKAELKALEAALECAFCLRVPKVRVVVDSESVSRGYNEKMFGWKAAGWRRSTGRSLTHASMWKSVASFPAKFHARGLRVTVVSEMREDLSSRSREMWDKAHELAMEGAEMHAWCAYCRARFGRAHIEHECEPICDEGSCDGRVFTSRAAYDEHCENVHSGKFECRRADCDAVLGSKKELHAHEWEEHENCVFSCDYCTPSYFRTKADAEDHEVSSCEWAPYCRICERWFKTLDSRKQHDTEIHGEYIEQVEHSYSSSSSSWEE